MADPSLVGPLAVEIANHAFASKQALQERFGGAAIARGGIKYTAPDQANGGANHHDGVGITDIRCAVYLSCVGGGDAQKQGCRENGA